MMADATDKSPEEFWPERKDCVGAAMNFDQYRAAPNDQEPDDICDQQWRRWGHTNDCDQLAAWIVILEEGPGFAVMCREHFGRFHDAQGGRGYTFEPYTRARAAEIKAATPLGG